MRSWLAFVAVALLLGWLVQPGQVDDAFIYLRYARNVLDGHGWVFNDGEWVNGATSAGNTLLLILFGFVLGGRLILAQILIFGLGIGSAGFFVQRLTRQQGLVPSLFASATVMTVPYLYWLVGMDTAPIAGFMCAAVWAWRSERWLLTALLLSLLCLVRGDGVFLALLLLGHFVWTHRNDLARARRTLLVAAAIFATPLLVWTAFSLATFGTALPKTLGAKLAQTASGLHGEPPVFVHHFFENLRLFLSLRLPQHWLASVATLALWFAVGAAGLVIALARSSPLVPLIVQGIAQFTAYAILDLPNYLWYFVPVQLSLGLCFAELAAATWAKPRLRWIAVLTIVAWLVPTLPEPRRATTHHAHYYELADWLAENAEPDAALACSEIGVLGWELPETRLIDMWGLVTKGGVDAIAAGDFGWWFQREKPELVLMHGNLDKKPPDPPWQGPELTVFARPEFHATYELWHQQDDLLLYRKKKN